MRTLLTCDGMHVGDAVIPAFAVSTNDYVGLAIPIDYGVQWNDLLQSLGGVYSTPEIRIEGRSTVISPSGFQQTEPFGILDVLLARGIPRPAAESAIVAFGLQSGSAYRNLQLTPRLLLDLRAAWYQGAELITFSTAGLDPLGMVAIAAEVSRMLAQCSAIQIFSSALIQHYESRIPFTKLVRCTLLEKQ